MKLRKGVHGLLVAVFEIFVSFIFCQSVPINGSKLLFVCLFLCSFVVVVVVIIIVTVVVSGGGGVMFTNESGTHRCNVGDG